MKLSSAKIVLGSGLVAGAALVLTLALGNPLPAAADVPSVAAPLPAKAALSPAPACVEDTKLSQPASVPNTVDKAKPVAYKAGTLLKGNDHLVYYVTETGERRLVYDNKTFSAYGFRPEDVIKIGDDVLTSIPMTGVLTRLAFDGDGNLFWVMDGQRWQVNEWKAVVSGPNYGEPTSRLDRSLQDTLPIRYELRSGTYLRQADAVYYLKYWSVIPVKAKSYDQVEVRDVPAEVLSVYEQQTTLDSLVTSLRADLPAANVRSGPGLGFEVVGVIHRDDKIVVTGRAKNSYWLRIQFAGQDGWLAGDLIRDQAVLNSLPTVEAPAPKAQSASTQPASNSVKYGGVGMRFGTVNGVQLIEAVMDGYPAQRAGVKPGDIVKAVDGEDVTGPASYNMVDKIRGPEGTTVNLTIFRSSTSETLNIPIVRAEINPADTSWICYAELVRGFGNTWLQHPEVRRWLGCPFTNFRQNEHATHAAVQTFQYGWMLWLETDTVANVDPIYVFYADDHSYVRYGDRKLVDAHAYAPTPQGFYKVGDRFAKIYWEDIGEQGRQRLGFATNEARDSQGAFQEFWNGRMFWAGEADTIYVIYQGYFDPDGDGQATWMRGWMSYEDTFEDKKP
jgi:hypothetical protein